MSHTPSSHYRGTRGIPVLGTSLVAAALLTIAVVASIVTLALTGPAPTDQSAVLATTPSSEPTSEATLDTSLAPGHAERLEAMSVEPSAEQSEAEAAYRNGAPMLDRLDWGSVKAVNVALPAGVSGNSLLPDPLAPYVFNQDTHTVYEYANGALTTVETPGDSSPFIVVDGVVSMMGAPTDPNYLYDIRNDEVIELPTVEGIDNPAGAQGGGTSTMLTRFFPLTRDHFVMMAPTGPDTARWVGFNRERSVEWSAECPLQPTTYLGVTVIPDELPIYHRYALCADRIIDVYTGNKLSADIYTATVEDTRPSLSGAPLPGAQGHVVMFPQPDGVIVQRFDPTGTVATTNVYSADLTALATAEGGSVVDVVPVPSDNGGVATVQIGIRPIESLARDLKQRTRHAPDMHFVGNVADSIEPIDVTAWPTSEQPTISWGGGEHRCRPLFVSTDGQTLTCLGDDGIEQIGAAQSQARSLVPGASRMMLLRFNSGSIWHFADKPVVFTSPSASADTADAAPAGTPSATADN